MRRPTMLATYRREAAAAQRVPGLLRSFRAYRLNEGLIAPGATYALEPRELIEELETDEDRNSVPARGGYLLGLDLSSSRDMSGVCGLWPDGSIRAYGVLPRVPDLIQRGREDRIDYGPMAAAGDLRLVGDRYVDLDEVVARIVTEWGSPSAVLFDSYRRAQLETALDRWMPSPDRILRRWGPDHGSEDLGNFRAAALDGKIRWPRSRLMRFTWSRALTTWSKGNEYLLKESGGKRRPGDDVALATILVASEQWRRSRLPKRRRKRRSRVVSAA